MNPQVVPVDILKKTNRVLFIAHLALGDFTYLQNFFQAFAKAHPHITIDLWIDEVRRTSKASQWPFLKKYALYDWVEQCPFFNTIYKENYSPMLYAASVRKAHNEHYPVVISLATLRPHLYADLARKIAPQGFVVGMQKPTTILQWHHRRAYRKLDAAILPYKKIPNHQHHITDEYTDWFNQISGLNLSVQERLPFITIPKDATQKTHVMLKKWQFDSTRKLIFINPYAKTKKRCWPLEHVTQLIRTLQTDAAWQHALFIVNAEPQALDHATAVISQANLTSTYIFSATDNFFQLPALLAECNFIISAETAVMHLANAVHVPVIALMRQKTPEWMPIDIKNSTVIMAPRRNGWVNTITVKQVTDAVAQQSRA